MQENIIWNDFLRHLKFLVLADRIQTVLTFIKIFRGFLNFSVDIHRKCENMADKTDIEFISSVRLRYYV